MRKERKSGVGGKNVIEIRVFTKIGALKIRQMFDNLFIINILRSKDRGFYFYWIHFLYSPLGKFQALLGGGTKGR
jgi:hypothetical protein